MLFFKVFSVLFLVFSEILAQYEDEPCEYSNGEKGICTKLSQCPSALEQVKILRRHDKKRCGFYRNEEIVCCNELKTDVITKLVGDLDDDSVWDEENQTGGGTISKNSLPMKTQRISEKACVEYSNHLPFKVDLHILGGIDAKAGEFPHMALLGYEPTEGGIEWNCGGSLISNRYVLTAAHCIRSPNSIRPSVVRMGMIAMSGGVKDDNNNPLAEDYRVENTTTHPEYVRKTASNDIGLLRLVKDVTFTTFINPACLYTATDDPVGLVVSGWGFTDRDFSERNDILQKAPVKAVSLENCNVTYAARKRILTSRQICAGSDSGDQDSCKGDSGGPLQKFMSNNAFAIVGIISFGMGCGGPVPAVYTRVASYLDWIEPIVWPNSVV